MTILIPYEFNGRFKPFITMIEFEREISGEINTEEVVLNYI